MSRYPWSLAADEDVSVPDPQAVLTKQASEGTQRDAGYDPKFGAAGALSVEGNLAATKRAMMEDAAKAAAVSMASAYAIGLIPVVGQALAAILAVIQVASGPYNKRHMKEAIATGVIELGRKVAATQDEVNNAAMQVAEAAFPGAQQLATSGQDLGDIRQWYTSAAGAVTDALRDVARPVAKPVGRLHTMPIRYIGFGILKMGEIDGRLVGDKQFTDKTKAKYRNWDEHSRHFDELTTRLAKDPVEGMRRVHGDPAKMAGGKSGTDVARKKIRDLLAATDVQLANFKAKALATFATDDYKAMVMLNEAKLIRQDPAMLARAEDIHRWEAQANDTLDRALTAAYAGQPTI